MLTDFYTVETVAGQDEEYTCVIRLNPEHNVYKGHFPGMPVVPGVCMRIDGVEYSGAFSSYK